MRRLGRRASAVTVVVALGVAAVFATPASSAKPRAVPDLARYVNPFNGTEPGAKDFGTGGGAANTFPGAATPFGMVQWSPDTLPGAKAFGGGYTHSDSRIKGFSVKHMSGPGCSAYQDFPFTPTTRPLVGSPAKLGSTDLADSFVSSFDHSREEASPGYYGVRLNPGTSDPIDAELTATTRTAAGRFIYPRTASASMLVNTAGSAMGTSDATVRIDAARSELSGSATSGQFCYQGNRYTLYFAARFNRPFASFGTWKGELLLPGSSENSDSIPTDPWVYQPLPGFPSDQKGTGLTARTGGYVTFDTRQNQAVEVRIGVSFVSVDNARNNLRAESDGRDFASIRSGGRRDWNALLSRVRVAGGLLDDKRMLYSSLYHSLIHPSTFSDADGEYTGFDGKVHTADGWTKYADYSGWDTYRSQMPLVAMLAPIKAADMARSLVADGEQSGLLPKWSEANGHTHVMVGDPADPIIASTYALGARRFDAGAALRAMVKGATEYGKASSRPDYYERPGLPEYLRQGYVPYEKNTDVVTATFQPELAWGSSATTLEYAVADFALARLAAELRDTATCDRFIRRGANWSNVLNRRVGYMQPRQADGRFREEVSASSGDGFVEGNAEQYTWLVPHDPAGLFDALGGRDAAARRLDEFFTDINAGPNSPHAFLGNEPTLGTPWLYDWIGQPYKAQRIVRRAMLELYNPSPSGFPGNDDLGSMSSWWVFGAIGAYPAVPGTGILALHGPLFPRITLRLPGGTIRIRARGARRDRPYVAALKLDGTRYGRPWLDFATLASGARLDYRMAAQPDPRWASDPRKAPPSFGPGERSCRPSPRPPAPRILLSVRPARLAAGVRVRLRFRATAWIGGRRRAVSGARVRFAGRRTRTNRRGRATLVVHLRRPGRYRAVARKRGLRRGVAKLVAPRRRRS